MPMRTISPGRFDIWLGPRVRHERYKLAHCPMKDGEEFQVRDVTVFLMNFLVVHMDSAQLTESLIVT